MNRFLLLASSFACLSPVALAQEAKTEKTTPAASTADTYRSVVRIEVATQVADYRTPWNTGRFGGGTGSGFMIGPKMNPALEALSAMTSGKVKAKL